MGFRDKILTMNKEKIKIEDIDQLISIVMDITAQCFYELISDRIVETYRTERKNNITGYISTRNLGLSVGRYPINHVFSNNGGVLNSVSIYDIYHISNDENGDQSCGGYSVHAEISFPFDSMIDFVDADGYVFGRPWISVSGGGVHEHLSRYTVGIDIYAIQNYLHKKMFLGKEYRFTVNNYAVELIERISTIAKEENVSIQLKIGVWSEKEERNVIINPNETMFYKGMGKNHFGGGIVIAYRTVV